MNTEKENSKLEEGTPTGLRLQDVLPSLDQPWYRNGYLVRLNVLLTVPLMASYLSGYDGSMLNGTQSLPIWLEDFNYPTGSSLGLMATMQTIGAAASLPIAPILADTLGRRHPIVIGSVICLLGTSLQTAAHALSLFLAGRFLLGLGCGIVTGACAPLLAELAYPSHRPLITALYNTTWYLGAIVAAWATYGTFKIADSWSWRIPSLLQAFPSLYQLFLVYLLPESPRWLVSKGRHDQAREVLVKHHAGGDTSSILVEYEIAEITAAIEMEKVQNTRSYMDFFSTKGNRWRFIIVFMLGFITQWSGNGLVSYYLVIILKSIGIKNAETQNLINGGLQLFNYATAILGATCVDRFGRRILLLSSTVGMAVTFLIWTPLSAVNQERNFSDSSLGIAIVIMIFVFYFFYNIAMNPVPVAYALEILPFTLRAKGITVYQFTVLGSAIFNGFVNPIALEAITWKYYIVFLALLLVWFVIIYFIMPETKGLSLEEVATVFDKSDAVIELAHGQMEEKKDADVPFHLESAKS